MAVDFQITEKGDIMFVQNKTNKAPFKLSFLPQKGIKIMFDVVDSMPINPNKKDMFKLSFNLKDLENNKDVMCVSGIDNNVQAINIRFKTPVGEFIDNLIIGSYLELVKHKNIGSASVLKQIESYVKDAVSDIISNPQIIVEPAISYVTNFSQAVNIYIYENGDLLYNTQIMR